MRRILITLLAFVLFVAAVRWAPVASLTARSTAALSYAGPGACTAFSIDARRQLFLTAAHCITEGEVKIDGYVAWVVWQDVEADLAVLHSFAVVKPSLRPGKSTYIGQELASLGYAYGHIEAVFKVHVVATREITVENLPGKWLLVGPAFIPGMSGGPVVNEDERVVGVILRATEQLGYARPISDVYALTKAFWEYQPS
jgi:S1-C subfamily serine protease